MNPCPSQSEHGLEIDLHVRFRGSAYRWNLKRMVQVLVPIAILISRLVSALRNGT